MHRKQMPRRGMRNGKMHLVQLLDDGAGELGGGGRASHVGGPDLTRVDDIERGAGDVVGDGVKAV